MLGKPEEILKKYYGYNEFRAGQKKVINSILKGKDTLAIMPTGAGKSLCFQIPALINDGITIVISPLISLMKDQVDSLNELGISATYINSSLEYEEIEKRILNVRSGEYKLIYVAPERLNDERFCAYMREISIAMIAIDEAHCVSQWGHDFRPSYRNVAQFIFKLTKRPVISAFTATATEAVKNDIIKLLRLSTPEVFVTGFNRENLSLSVIKGENKKNFVEKYLENNKGKTGIIYTSTRKEAEYVYIYLNKQGYSVGVYHAGLSESDRAEIQEDFSYDNIDIIVATNAFGMGIDKSNVRFVIHYNMPKNIEAYYQEAGRAGRDGEPSECILLFDPKDVQTQKYFIEETVSNEERKLYEYNKLQSMIDYCYTSKCLRKYILEYFGETDVVDQCDNCSICNDDREVVDITIEAQKIFSCIYRMKEQYGVNMVVEVLKGSKNQKVLEHKLDELSTYGIVKNYTKKQMVDMTNKLIADGYLRVTEGQYPLVKLMQKSLAVLKGKEKVFMKINKTKKKVETDNKLFDLLRELRKEIALREKIPPYIVFGDASIREMSEHMPQTMDEMLSIKGVGEHKFEKYGEEFIAAIKKYIDEENINKKDKVLSQSETACAKDEDHKEKEKIKSHIVTYRMYKTGLKLQHIAEARGITITTVENHIFTCKSEGIPIDLDDFIPKEEKELIFNAIEFIGEESESLLKEALPQDIEYFTIKAAIYKYNEEKKFTSGGEHGV